MGLGMKWTLRFWNFRAIFFRNCGEVTFSPESSVYKIRPNTGVQAAECGIRDIIFCKNVVIPSGSVLPGDFY